MSGMAHRRWWGNEWVASAAFHSADSGGEAAIGWIADQRRPPRITDFNSMQIRTLPRTNLHASQEYAYDVRFRGQRARPGWSLGFTDFLYDVSSEGEAGAHGRADVALRVGKIQVQGYQAY